MKKHQDTNFKRAFSVWIKTIACVLSLLLALYAVPTNVFAELIEAIDTVTDSNDEQTTVEETEPGKEGTVFEVIDRREETVKHFRTEDGSFTAVQYNVPVHERDENGEWQDIDNTLSESGSEYATPNAKIKFTKKIPGNEGIFTLHDGNRKITMSLSGARKKVEGQVTNTQTEFPEDATQLQKMMTLDKLSSKILYPEILDGVDLEYVVNSCNIKENIIVKERADSYSYTFEIQLNNLEAVLCEDGSVAISDPDTGEVVYTIPKGYMFDADGEYSDAVMYALTNGGNGKYALTVTADAEWINDDERAFPVTIDPPIMVNSNSQMTDTYIDSANPIVTYYNATNLKVGRTASDITSVSLWKLNDMPDIPANAYIVSAELSLKLTSISTHYSNKIGAYTVTTDWTTNNAYSWSVADLTSLCAESRLIDFADTYGATAGSTVMWDITSAFRTWYGNNSVSRGIALAPITPDAMSAVFASANSATSTQPQLVVEYRDMKGVESYWSGSSHSAGTAGSGYVNHASGNLVFSIGTVSTTDSLFNFTPTLVYNSAVTDKYNYTEHNTNVPYRFWSSGYGWKLNTNESIVKPLEENYYVWSDGDGTEHYFLPDTSSNPTVYKDEDGLLLTLTVSEDGYTITDVDGNTRFFERIITSTKIEEGGALKKITDIYGNELLFSLNDYGQTTAISVKPKGHSTAVEYLTFTYNSLYAVTEIRNAFTKQVVSFTYAMSYTNQTSVSNLYAGPLYQVKYGHLSGSTVVHDATMTYTYTSAMGPTYGNIYRLATATDDSTGLSIHYAYDTSGRVSTVTEYSGTTAGQSVRYTYGKGYTEVRNSGNDDVLQNSTNSDDIITHYSIDYQGRAVSVYSTNAARTAMYGATNSAYEYPDSENGPGTGDSGNTKNSLKASAVINGVAVNHLHNGSFEYGVDAENTDTIYGWVKSVDDIFYDYKYNFSYDRMLRLSVTPGTSKSIYQDVILPSGTYTLSVDSYSYSDGAKITLKASVGTETLEEKTYTMYGLIDESNALSPTITFTVDTNQTVRITITIESSDDGSIDVFLDNVMLENNIGAGSFNAVQFGGFSNTYANTNNSASPTGYWSMTYADASISSGVGLQGHGLKISGNVNEYQWVSQRITVTSQELIDMANRGTIALSPLQQSRTFTVSGFAKAAAQIANEGAYFSIDVEVYYYGYSAYDTFYFNFNKEISDWQFISGTFTTDPGKVVQYIDVCCTYAHQPNTAYFDNISLVEEKGSNSANYLYNANGLPEFMYTPADCVYYEYDENDNLIFTYDSQGNGHYSQYNGKKLVSETTFKFDITNFNLLEWYVTDGEPQEDNLVDQLSCTVISKTEYNINTYGLNTSTVSYSATGEVRSATQKTNTPKLTSSTEYNLTIGSYLFGRPTSTTDTSGNTIVYGYDSQGRRIYESNSEYEGLYYNYDALGRVTSVTPIVHATSTDTFHPQSGAENVQYTYDPQTNRLSQINTATTTYSFEYDEFGNTYQIKAGTQTLARYRYHANNGKLWKMQYGTGKVIEYKYDDLDRIQEICYNDNNGIAQSYKYVYTATGAIHSIESTESGRLYLYNYNSKGQLIGYTECGKDANGEYTAQLQNFYTYDEMDRIQYWQGSFNYVANGTTYSDAVGYWYEYLDYGDTSSTNIGELDMLSVLEAGINRETTISYEYDEFYRLKGKLLDTAGALSITTGYTFREVSHKTSMLVSSYTSTVSGASGTTANSYSYTYDVDGNITQIVDGNGKKISYKYDDLGQLLRENNQILGKTYVYTYDKAGNRTSKKTYAYTTGTLGTVTETESYTYSAGAWKDQLTQIKKNDVVTATFSYDTIGNPTTFNGYDLTWHGRQLKQMSRNGGQSLLKFMYNADGIRTNKIVDGVNHVYTLNGTQIVSEAWGTNLLIYLYDESGAPIGMQYRTNSYAANVFDRFYFEKNLQGDIIAVYNADGDRIGSYIYDAWGNFTVTVESTNTTLENRIVRIFNPFRYRGYYYDTETQLYYLQSRYYNPAWGRFLNADGLISTGQGLLGYNMYAYCNNNPVMYVDPDGDFPWLILIAAAVLIGSLTLTGCSSNHQSEVSSPRSDLVNAPDLDINSASNSSYNCYGNAINKQIVTDPSGYQRGDSVEDTFLAVQKDLGGERNCKRLASFDAPVEDGWYVVAMMCGNSDYHFIRYIGDGYWYNKSGSDPFVGGCYLSTDIVNSHTWHAYGSIGNKVYKFNRPYDPTYHNDNGPLYFAVRIGWDKED